MPYSLYVVLLVTDAQSSDWIVPPISPLVTLIVGLDPVLFLNECYSLFDLCVPLHWKLMGGDVS